VRGGRARVRTRELRLVCHHLLLLLQDVIVYYELLPGRYSVLGCTNRMLYFTRSLHQDVMVYYDIVD
jgi:hypothetical protein